MKIVIGFILGFITMAVIALADKIPSPPPIKENSALYKYLFELYENFHRFEVVTTNPDGNRRGLLGDTIILQTGGTTYLEVNTNSSTQWRGIALSDTP